MIIYVNSPLTNATFIGKYYLVFYMSPLIVFDLEDDYGRVKEFIIRRLAYYAGVYTEIVYGKMVMQRPYWKRGVIKDLKTIAYLNNLIRDNKIENIIVDAILHFKEVRKARAYNVLFRKVYLGYLRSNSKKKKYKHFYYYLAIRIRKVKLLKRGKKPRLGYLIQVTKMCPFGQYYHNMPPENTALKGQSLIQPKTT